MARDNCEQSAYGVDWGQDGPHDFGTPDASGRLVFTWPGVVLAIEEDDCLSTSTPDALGTEEDPLCLSAVCELYEYDCEAEGGCPADPPATRTDKPRLAICNTTNEITCWWDPSAMEWVPINQGCCVVTFCIVDDEGDVFTGVVVRNNLDGTYSDPVFISADTGLVAEPVEPIESCGSQPVKMVNGGGFLLTNTFGPDNDAYAVQEPLLKCATSPMWVQKDDIVWTEDTKPIETFTRVNADSGTINLASTNNSPNNGPTLTVNYVNPDLHRDMQPSLEYAAQLTIEATHSFGNHVGVRSRVLFSQDGGAFIPFATEQHQTVSHTNSAQPTSATGHTLPITTTPISVPLLGPAAGGSVAFFVEYTRIAPLGTYLTSAGSTFRIQQQALVQGRSL